MAYSSELSNLNYQNKVEKKKGKFEGLKKFAFNLGLTAVMTGGFGLIGGAAMEGTAKAHKYDGMPTTPPIESLIEYAGNNFGNVAGPEALQRATSKEGNNESHKLLAGFTKAYIEGYKLSNSTLGAEYKAQEFLLKNGAQSSPEIEKKQQNKAQYLVPNTKPVELKHGLTTKQFEVEHQKKLVSAEKTGEFGGRAIGFAAGLGISMLNTFKGLSKRKEQQYPKTQPRTSTERDLKAESLNNLYKRSESIASEVVNRENERKANIAKLQRMFNKSNNSDEPKVA